jgi:hypothetical protein
MEKASKLTGTILLLLTIVAASEPLLVFGQTPLIVTLATDKSSYKYREEINVVGDLSLNGVPEGGFVGIEVNPLNPSFSNYTHFLTRTATIGKPYIGPMNITIESVATTDLSSPPQPKTEFRKGEKLGVNVTVRNYYVDDRTVVITVMVCDNDSTPITSEVAYVQTSISGNGGIVQFYPQFAIDLWVSTGSAQAYVNVFSDWPSHGGHPWCSEKSKVFMITQADSSFSKFTQKNEAPFSSKVDSENEYEVSFRMPPYAPEGYYLVNVSAFSQGWITQNSTTFSKPNQVLGDVDLDHKVTILDVVLVASVYGSKSGDSRWNPTEDLAPDGKVNIFDIVAVTSNYGLKY